MGVRFCILGSSSGGNCGLLQTPQASVLIDAGFSARRTGQMLATFGQSLAQIDAVFVTHEHIDHVKGLPAIAGKAASLRVFATYGTRCAAQNQIEDTKLKWGIIQPGAEFEFADLRVKAFSVPHDAMDTVGYLFTTGDDSPGNPVRRLAWMTDLGHIPRQAAESAAQADILVIEANHDLKMLEDSPRPFQLKQRIRSSHGHLSNEQTLEYLRTVENPRWRHIYLAHVSPECNDVALLRSIFGDSLHGDGVCPISIVDPRTGCEDVTELGPWKREELVLK
jgi:phosphoribosyl 1,2-cyclic phosphodiesterase